MSDDSVILLGDRAIGRRHPPFIAAEMSANHNQSLDRALAIVDAAADAGAHGLKLQTYTADTMTMNVDRPEFYVHADDNPWTGRHLYKLYGEAYTPWEWDAPIFERAREKAMVPFSTPFDESAVDFLERFNIPFYKIASFENNCLPLIRKLARTGKPLVISTGMANIGEVQDAVDAARSEGCTELILLKCTSSYAATASASNLVTLPHMRDLFRCALGLSDHTLDVGVAIASIAFGACFIEKHVTLDRDHGGLDADFSLNPSELFLLTTETKRAAASLGTISYGVNESEAATICFQRSLYFTRDLKAGDTVTSRDVRIIRPAHGLRPNDINTVLGMTLSTDAEAGTPVSWPHFQTSGV
jgi:N-acetylneuraminate synthase